jgi:hypothetical protein
LPTQWVIQQARTAAAGDEIVTGVKTASKVFVACNLFPQSKTKLILKLQYSKDTQTVSLIRFTVPYFSYMFK